MVTTRVPAADAARIPLDASSTATAVWGSTARGLNYGEIRIRRGFALRDLLG
jgi:hypothetical protein